jgi:hypothetical protein
MHNLGTKILEKVAKNKRKKNAILYLRLFKQMNVSAKIQKKISRKKQAALQQ